MTKICAYTRVSTDKNDQINSLLNQERYFTMKAEQDKDIELVKIYADEGLTGTNNNRPQFIQMLKDAGLHITPQISSFTKKPLKNKFNYEINPNVEPKFEEIWIKNTSRFARNTLSQEIIDLLITKGVHIFFVEQNIHTKDELSRGLLLKLFQVFDEQDSKDKSLKIRQGRKTAAMAGKLISNGQLYGYDYRDGELTIIEEEAQIIREIFDLYANGLGIRKIVKLLKEKGYKTRNNKDFSKSTISRILENEKYKGALATNKWDTGVVFRKKTPVVKPKSEWYVFPDKIPKIVSEQLFDKCQEIRASKVGTKNQRGINHGYSEYSGMVVCGQCGEAYHSNSDRGRNFYNCSNKKINGVTACDNPNISKKIIDEEIERYCNEKYYDVVVKRLRLVLVSALEQQREGLKELLSSSNTSYVDKLNQEIDKKKQGLIRILDLYENLEIEKEEYLKRKERLETEIAEIENKIRNMGLSSEQINSRIEKLNKAITAFKNRNGKVKYERDELINKIKYIKVIKSADGKRPIAVPVFEELEALNALNLGDDKHIKDLLNNTLEQYKFKHGIV